MYIFKSKEYLVETLPSFDSHLKWLLEMQFDPVVILESFSSRKCVLIIKDMVM